MCRSVRRRSRIRRGRSGNRENRPETSYILLLWWHKFGILVYVTKEAVTMSTINQTTYLTISALLLVSLYTTSVEK